MSNRPYILCGKIDVPAIKYMDFINDGRTLYFRLPENESRTFIGKNSHDFAIEKPERHLHARFENGAWHYTNECPECNGVKEHYFFGYCDKHDTCVSCGTNTKDLAKGVERWGIRNGSFLCTTCKERKEKERRRAALESFDEENFDEFDYKFNHEPKCPYCGTVNKYFEYDGDNNPEPIECETCQYTYKLEIDWEITYSTKRIGPKQ